MDSSEYYQRLEALGPRIQRLMNQAEYVAMLAPLQVQVSEERRQNREVDPYARELELIEQELARLEAKAAA